MPCLSCSCGLVCAVVFLSAPLGRQFIDQLLCSLPPRPLGCRRQRRRLGRRPRQDASIFEAMYRIVVCLIFGQCCSPYSRCPTPLPSLVRISHDGAPFSHNCHNQLPCLLASRVCSGDSMVPCVGGSQLPRKLPPEYQPSSICLDLLFACVCSPTLPMIC